ncbi:hypothetical protein HUJ04_009745 [Dendroctonus ponderosae]|nr:hypothetical protein HUJ04_009745 [Dendroctonus ponderosae]
MALEYNLPDTKAITTLVRTVALYFNTTCSLELIMASCKTLRIQKMPSTTTAMDATSPATQTATKLNKLLVNEGFRWPAKPQTESQMLDERVLISALRRNRKCVKWKEMKHTSRTLPQGALAHSNTHVG